MPNVKRECRIAPLCNEIRRHKEFRTPIRAFDLQPKQRAVKHFRDLSPPPISCPSVGYPHLPYAFKRMCETRAPSATWSSSNWNRLNIPNQIPPISDLPAPAYNFLKKRPKMESARELLPREDCPLMVDKALTLYIQWKNFCDKIDLGKTNTNAIDRFLMATRDLLNTLNQSEKEKIKENELLRNIFARPMTSNSPLAEAHNAIHHLLFEDTHLPAIPEGNLEGNFDAAFTVPVNAFNQSLPELPSVPGEKPEETEPAAEYVMKIPFRLQELQSDSDVPPVAPVSSASMIPETLGSDTSGEHADRCLKFAAKQDQAVDKWLHCDESPRRRMRDSTWRKPKAAKPWRLTPVHLPDWSKLYYIPLRRPDPPLVSSHRSTVYQSLISFRGEDRRNSFPDVDGMASKIALTQSCHELHKAPVQCLKSIEDDEMFNLESWKAPLYDLAHENVSQFNPEEYSVFGVNAGPTDAIMIQLANLFKDNEDIGTHPRITGGISRTDLQILDKSVPKAVG